MTPAHDTSSSETQSAVDPVGHTSQHRLRRLRAVHRADGSPHGHVVLGDAPVLIGRAPYAPGPFALNDREVSKRHAVISATPGAEHAYRIDDDGSRNGTFVDGLRVDGAPLQPGAVIRIGGNVLVYAEDDLPSVLDAPPPTCRLLGQSVAMAIVKADIVLVAPRPVPVLIHGETGVGKELVAAELHARSGRSGNFVPINCAALPESLAESELFGHVRGAFSGASGPREGLFAAARGGTLFLDEIGELSPALQAKLLRALATGEIRPVGGDAPGYVDVRVVAATHRDLESAVASGAFREDLLARLSGWRIRVPPLRARREDITLLSWTFLDRSGGGSTLTTHAAEVLTLYDWPHNVRELERVIEAAAVRARGGPIGLSHLPDAIATPLRARAAVGPAPPAALPIQYLVPPDHPPDRDGLFRVAAHFGGNMQRVAGYFGKDRKQVYRWLARLGVSIDDLRSS